MYVKEIEFEDFLGNKRKETFHFNLTKAELTRMEVGQSGGLSKYLQKIVDGQDIPELSSVFEKFITMSYGEISSDGREFIKSKELTEKFMQTNAYSELYMKLVTDDEAAAEFLNGIIPNMESERAKANIPAPDLKSVK